jgi:hypothetical protein
MSFALLFSILFKWAEYMALILGLSRFYLSVKKVLIYRNKNQKEASDIKFKRGQSGEGGFDAVFFERM